MSITTLLLAACVAAITPNDEGIMGVDDSASIQAAVDKAASDGVGEVVIPAFNARTGKARWEIARSIRLPSKMTVVIDNAYLRMKDDVYENFFRSANIWSGEKLSKATEMHDIRIIGRGLAVLDGGKKNDLSEITALKDGRPHVRANIPIHFDNVRDFEVSGLKIENHRYWGMCYSFCRNGLIRDIRIIGRYDRRNQDGINLRNGCCEITIENISGQTGDDTIALSAIDLLRNDQWNMWVSDKSPDIYNVRIRNITSAAVRHPLVALRAQNGSKIHDVVIENLNDAEWADEPDPANTIADHNRPRYAVVALGGWAYWNTCPSKLGDLYNITVRNVTSRFSEVAVEVKGALKDSIIENVRCYGMCAGVLTLEGAGYLGAGATLDNVIVANSSVDSTARWSYIVNDKYVGYGDFLRDFRVVNCSVVENGKRAFVKYDVRDSGSKIEPVKCEIMEGLRLWNGRLTLEQGANAGTFTTAPFYPDSDNPVLDWLSHERRNYFTIEYSIEKDGVWTEFVQAVRSKHIDCPKTCRMRYRLNMRRNTNSEPYIVMMLVGHTKQTRWVKAER